MSQLRDAARRAIGGGTQGGCRSNCRAENFRWDGTGNNRLRLHAAEERKSIRCRCCKNFAEAGARLALPAIAGRGKPLIMRAWEFGAPLDRGQWGSREPKPEAPEVEPDILLVPLLAFDRAGYSLGYGAGYYDMTIHRLRALKPVTAVGIALRPRSPEIPTTPRDERLDLVLTEREVIDLR